MSSNPSHHDHKRSSTPHRRLNTRQYVHGLIGDAAMSKAPLIPDGLPNVPTFKVVESRPESDVIHITSEKMSDLESACASFASRSRLPST